MSIALASDLTLGDLSESFALGISRGDLLPLHDSEGIGRVGTQGEDAGRLGTRPGSSIFR